ncbi:MAG: hypothetical protein ACP5I8_16765 [Phycisphaerae bacterium]
MKIHVFSREEIEVGVLIKSAYVVISISDPDKPRPKIKKQAGLREVLYLAFNDAEPSSLLEPSPEIKNITPEQANEICNFVHRHKADVGAIVVHCEQGMSRSPAVAAAISDALGLNPKRFWQLHTPNEYVYHTVSDAFDRYAATKRKDN